jgi:hypothetical protein
VVPDGFGDKTRLRVTGVHTAEQYYRQDGTRAPLLDTSQPGSGFPLTHMVAYDDGVVANVPSAEGLVVYNDSVVEDLDGRSAERHPRPTGGLGLGGPPVARELGRYSSIARPETSPSAKRDSDLNAECRMQNAEWGAQGRGSRAGESPRQPCGHS